jgi:hypothetical protein
MKPPCFKCGGPNVTPGRHPWCHRCQAEAMREFRALEKARIRGNRTDDEWKEYCREVRRERRRLRKEVTA